MSAQEDSFDPTEEREEERRKEEKRKEGNRKEGNRKEENKTEENDDEPRTSQSKSSFHSIPPEKTSSMRKLLDEIQSADDVSLMKKSSKDGMSWQCLSELPSIQTMTNFLLNTCHNYRQTMKAVLSGKHPHAFEDGKCNGDTEINDGNSKDECCTSRKMACPRKRGRPPGRNGPAKRMRSESVTDLFEGKLCNLVRPEEDEDLIW